jgi:hypothetical protein
MKSEESAERQNIRGKYLYSDARAMRLRGLVTWEKLVLAVFVVVLPFLAHILHLILADLENIG